MALRLPWPCGFGFGASGTILVSTVALTTVLLGMYSSSDFCSVSVDASLPAQGPDRRQLLVVVNEPSFSEHEHTPSPPRLTVLMIEDRLDKPTYRSSIAQKRAWARKHGYAFYCHADGTIYLDPQRSEVPYAFRKRAERVAELAQGCLDDEHCSGKFSSRARSLFEVAADFPSKENENEIEATTAKQKDQTTKTHRNRNRYPFGHTDKQLDAMRQAVLSPEFKAISKEYRAMVSEMEYCLDDANQGKYLSNQPWGAFYGPWAKLPVAIEYIQKAPEGGWIWLVDSDMIIRDMENSLESVLKEAELDGKDMILVYWNCGDGTNLGSWFIRNTEYGRLVLRRIQDARLVWQLYFDGARVQEQGAMWVLQAGDNDFSANHLFNAEPRAINARDKHIRCSEDPKVQQRVYWQEGDFVVHLAALTRGYIGRQLMISHLNETGFWPCPDDCSVEPILASQNKPNAAKKSINNNLLRLHMHIVVGGNETRNDADPWETEKFNLQDRLLELGAVDSVHVRDADAYMVEGSEVSDRMIQFLDMPRIGNNPARGGSIFGSPGGWSRVAAGRWALGKMAAEASSSGDESEKSRSSSSSSSVSSFGSNFDYYSDSNWLVVASATDGESRISAAMTAFNSTVAKHTPHAGHTKEEIEVIAVLRRDCETPWFIKINEQGRGLLTRLADGFLQRPNRIDAKGNAGRGDVIEKMNANEALCWLVQSDLEVAAAVRQLDDVALF